MIMTFDPDEPLAQRIREAAARGEDVAIYVYTVKKSAFKKIMDARLESWTWGRKTGFETEWVDTTAELTWEKPKPDPDHEDAVFRYRHGLDKG